MEYGKRKKKKEYTKKKKEEERKKERRKKMVRTSIGQYTEGIKAILKKCFNIFKVGKNQKQRFKKEYKKGNKRQKTKKVEGKDCYEIYIGETKFNIEKRIK